MAESFTGGLKLADINFDSGKKAEGVRRDLSKKIPGSELDGTEKLSYITPEDAKRSKFATDKDYKKTQRILNGLGQVDPSSIPQRTEITPASRLNAWAATLVAGVGIAVGSAFPDAASAETPKPPETTVENEWYSMALPTEAALRDYGYNGSDSYETPAPDPNFDIPEPEFYAIKQGRIAEYKRLLKENGVDEINLEVFAHTIDSAIQSEIVKGFTKDKRYTQPEKTILGNYCNIDQIFEVAKNPNMEIPEDWNWYPVLAKDSDGNMTNEVLFNYFFDKDNPHISIDEMYKIVDEYETLCPGFFKVMNKNSCYTWLHSQAGKKSQSNMHYGFSMMYINSSEKNFKFLSGFIFKGLGVEPIAVQLCDLGGSYADNNINGFLKSAAAFENFTYLYKITKNKKFKANIEEYRAEMNKYSKNILRVFPSKEPVYKLYEKATAENLITPYAASWEKIHSVVNIIDELRASN